MASHPPDRNLRINTVLDRTGLSRTTIYRKIPGGMLNSGRHVHEPGPDRPLLLRLTR